MSLHQNARLSVSLMSVCVFVCWRCFYIQWPCTSLSSFPSPFPLAVGDSSSAAQLDDHLLAVVEGSLVSQLLQGAGCVCQHAHPLAGSRQKGGRKVAARQHYGLRLLPLARPCLALLCTQQHKKTSVTVVFRVSFLMSSATGSQSDFSCFLFNYWWDLVKWTIGQNRWEAD